MKHATARHVMALAIVLPSLACDRALPPRGQILVVVDTDAVVPLPRGAQLDPTRMAPHVDRARFEVLVDGKPLAGKAREFAVDEAMFRERKVSFGVLPEPPDGAVSVRVRLFRADRLFSDTPPPGVTLDTIATLPPVAADKITTVTVMLRVDDFGRTVGPLPAVEGAPTASAVSTWHGGHRVACAGIAESFESCVPGGTFFLGDPALRGRSSTNDVTEERLVEVSPFFLDRTEVTVGAFRERWPALAATGVQGPLVHDPSPNADVLREEPSCTWTETSALLADGTPPDRLPLNCVSWMTAREYCRARGAELPSEAQLEYVSSGLGAESAYPWGNDEPDCAAAIWGRARAGSNGASTCLQLGGGTSPRPAFPGSGVRDTVDTAPFGVNSEIVDLGGNLSEWALDVWSRPTEGFWNHVTPMMDPVASIEGVDANERVGRSGNWFGVPLLARAALRLMRAPDTRLAYLGFRCARPAKRSP